MPAPARLIWVVVVVPTTAAIAAGGTGPIQIQQIFIMELLGVLNQTT